MMSFFKTLPYPIVLARIIPKEHILRVRDVREHPLDMTLLARIQAPFALDKC